MYCYQPAVKSWFIQMRHCVEVHILGDTAGIENAFFLYNLNARNGTLIYMHFLLRISLCDDDSVEPVTDGWPGGKRYI